LSPTPHSVIGIYACTNCSGVLCEKFSGSPVLSAYHENSTKYLERPYYVLADEFSRSILFRNPLEDQALLFNNIINPCQMVFSTMELTVYHCGQDI